MMKSKKAQISCISVCLFITDNNECSVDNGGCTFECLQTPQGAVCVCPVGQQLNGTKLCVGKQTCVFTKLQNVFKFSM